MYNKFIKLCFCLFTPISVCIAQDNIFGPYPTARDAVAENVSIASGYSQPIESAPAVTSVITAEQIKKAQYGFQSVRQVRPPGVPTGV